MLSALKFASKETTEVRSCRTIVPHSLQSFVNEISNPNAVADLRGGGAPETALI